MRSTITLQAVLVMASLAAGGLAHANLLTNGSFELGTFIPDPNDTQTFTAGATTMTGWTTVGNFVSRIGATNPFLLSAQDGSFFLDLTGYHTGTPFGGVTQTVATTPGQQYELSFYLGSYTARWGGPPVSILASAGGTSQTFTDSASTRSSTWTRETLAFTATGSSTLITLTGAAGVQYIGLDNVSLNPVPEPSTWVMLLIGVAGLCVVSYRGRRNGSTRFSAC